MTDTLAPAAPPPPPTTVRSLSCPNCGGTIALRAAGSTVSVVCEHCGSTLDATQPPLKLIVQANQAMHRPPIALGTRGLLAGIAWEVVGYQERSDGEIGWSEYLLFNPYEGYGFLVDDGRRFSLGRLMTVMPGSNWRGLEYGGRSFARFGDTYPVTTHFVVGEFYWRVRAGDVANETDYVTPGTMLVCEETPTERTWTQLEMQGWGVAERAFGIEPRKDQGGNPAPHEPSPYRTAMRDAWLIAALALAACVVIAIGTAISTRVFARDLTVGLDGRTQTTVLGPISVPGAREKVHIEGRAGNLDNMWVDLDYSLVNRQTQQSYDAYGLAEQYHGSDSDGPWTEGNGAPDTGLASIPHGTYDLVVEATAHRWTDPKASSGLSGIFGSTPADDSGVTVPVSITVDRGGGFVGPFFLAMLAILVWPLIAWGRHRGFEKRRTASVTPASSASDDDDSSWSDD